MHFRFHRAKKSTHVIIPDVAPGGEPLKNIVTGSNYNYTTINHIISIPNAIFAKKRPVDKPSTSNGMDHAVYFAEKV